MAGETIAVLIIDADNVRRGMLACTLPTSSYALQFAKSAQAGLDLLASLRPQVVIIGQQDETAALCQQIRTTPPGKRCMLVLIDEHCDTPAPGPTANTNGIDITLPFPFQLDAFEEQLSRYRRGVRLTEENLILPQQDPRAFPENAAPTDDSTEDDATGDDQAWREFRQRVDHFFLRLESADYFQLLEVDRNASPAEIKEAYFEHSMEFHPDRFTRLSDQKLKNKNYTVYKRMSEAFRVLSRPEARTRYQENLEGPPEHRSLRYHDPERSQRTALEPATGARTPAGRRYLSCAQQAQEDGNLKSARMYLTLAVQCEPQNPDLRHQLDQLSGQLGIDS